MALVIGVRIAPSPHAETDPPASGRTAVTSQTTTTTPGRPYTTIPPDWPDEPSPRADPVVLDGLMLHDVTNQAGLDRPHLGREPDGTNDMSGGAAAADYDKDGDVDLYLTRVGLPNLLYRNDGHGRFTDVARQAGVQGLQTDAGYAGAVWADVDGDGDLDLWVTSVGRARNLLYVNRGDGTFTEEAEARGLIWPPVQEDSNGSNTFSSAFADWDHDGDLDLVVVDWYTAPTGTLATGQAPGVSRTEVEALGNDVCQVAALSRRSGFAVAPGAPSSRTRLYENDGTGRFSDITDRLGVDPSSMAAFGVTFADYDGDGWVDLFVSADFCTSKLLRNDHGLRFVDVTAEVGVGTDQNGMGQAVEDIDGDGDLDWIESAISFPASAGRCPPQVGTIGCTGNRGWINDGTGRFSDGTDRLGMRDAYWAWGVAAVDLTNTGYRDVVMATGYAMPKMGEVDLHRENGIVHRRSAGSPSRLWRNPADHQDGPWPEVAQQVGFTNRGNGKSLLSFDMDGDGDLDLLQINTEVPPVLYRNDTPIGAGRRWVEVSLDDQTSANRAGIGAKVTVIGTDGRRQVSEVRAGGTFQGSNPPSVHFGLGQATGSVTVQVRWPDGIAIETFHSVASGRSARLVRGQGER